MSRPPDEPWLIVLSPLPGDQRPVGRRVARLLKFARRTCGLRQAGHGRREVGVEEHRPQRAGQ